MNSTTAADGGTLYFPDWCKVSCSLWHRPVSSVTFQSWWQTWHKFSRYFQGALLPGCYVLTLCCWSRGGMFQYSMFLLWCSGTFSLMTQRPGDLNSTRKSQSVLSLNIFTLFEKCAMTLVLVTLCEWELTLVSWKGNGWDARHVGKLHRGKRKPRQIRL